LIAPQLAKPYVKRGKNDSADAQAVCEAASRPTMRLAAVKSAGQQAALMLAGQRERLVRQRVQLANTIRGHAAEFGIVAAKGLAQIPALLQRVQRDEVPELARALFADLADEYAGLEARIANIDARLKAWYKDNETARRLADIPGVGPLIASLLVMKTPDSQAFRSGRDYAAWLGLTPRDYSTARKCAARPHHARRRRDAAQSFGGRRHGDDLADPAPRRTPGFITPSLALAPHVIAAQAGKTRGSRARQEDCASPGS
jgi:transposase